MIILIVVFVVVIAVFSQAGECYYCGSRKVTQKTAWGTKAICDKCWCKGKELP